MRLIHKNGNLYKTKATISNITSCEIIFLKYTNQSCHLIFSCQSNTQCILKDFWIVGDKQV